MADLCSAVGQNALLSADFDPLSCSVHFSGSAEGRAIAHGLTALFSSVYAAVEQSS